MGIFDTCAGSEARKWKKQFSREGRDGGEGLGAGQRGCARSLGASAKR